MGAIDIVTELGEIPGSQHGYFTRRQAVSRGITPKLLSSNVERGRIEHCATGIYRVPGSGSILFADLWIAWLRVTNVDSQLERIRGPKIWVSHESAARVYRFGDFIADTHHFTVLDRCNPRPGIVFHRRSRGLNRYEWTTKDGFAVTSAARTAADLFAANVDHGHIGRFLDDALRVNATTIEAVVDATPTNITATQVKATLS